MEKGDASYLEVGQDDAVKSSVASSLAVDAFRKGWAITWYAMQSLSLGCAIKEEQEGKPIHICLPSHSKDCSFAFGGNVPQEKQRKEEWKHLGKGEGWSTIICYNVTFIEEDLCQEQTNKEEVKEEDERPER